MKKENASIAIFKILSDQKRYRAIVLLGRSKRSRTVAELAEDLSMTHSAASHMLGLLHKNDIVSYRKEGREIGYMLAGSSMARMALKAARSI